MKLFGKKQKLLDEVKKEERDTNISTKAREDFINSLKNESKEESQKINLFQLFRTRKIKEEDLNEEQKEIISEMYDKKILEEKKKIEYLKNKLLKSQNNA